jgi:hypothetical protein
MTPHSALLLQRELLADLGRPAHMQWRIQEAKRQRLPGSSLKRLIADAVN